MKVRPSASLLLSSVVGAAVLAGCTVQATVKSKTRFVEDGVTLTSSEPWAGEAVTVRAEGVGVAVNGGVVVRADPAATSITATARMVAMAEPEDKASADQSIIDAKQTFRIERGDGGFTIVCGHGGSHGTSSAGESGCELVTVTVPAGSEAQPISVKALSGNGEVKVDLSASTLARLDVNAKGDVDAKFPASKGASVSIVAEQADDIVARVPADFAADSVTLTADPGSIDNGFSDLTLDESGHGTRGAAGTGAASISLTSKPFAGSSGRVTLTPY